MADSIRERILTRIKTNLDAATGGVTVYRSRVEPLARGEVPAIIVEPVADQPNDEFFTKLQWQLRVRVTVLVRANAPDDDSDAFTQQVHKLIIDDPTCNSLALDIDPDRTEFSLYEADVPLAVVSMDYLVKYRSDREDLTSS